MENLISKFGLFGCLLAIPIVILGYLVKVKSDEIRVANAYIDSLKYQLEVQSQAVDSLQKRAHSLQEEVNKKGEDLKRQLKDADKKTASILKTNIPAGCNSSYKFLIENAMEISK